MGKTVGFRFEAMVLGLLLSFFTSVFLIFLVIVLIKLFLL